MSLADEIHRALTGGVPRGGEPPVSTRVDAVRSQVARQSNVSVAKALGVGEATVRRWRSGSTRPSPGNLQKIADAFAGLPLAVQRAAMLKADAAERWRGNGMSVTIKYGSSTRGRSRPDRTQKLSDRNLSFAGGTGERVVAAWLRGDDKAAARAFRDGIGDDKYRQWFFTDNIDDSDLAYEGGEDADDAYAVTVVGAH